MFQQLFSSNKRTNRSVESGGDFLRRVDVAFVVDTTGSMGGFIQEAKTRLLDMMTQLRQVNGLDLQMGLVEYRDHPPQDRTFITRRTRLTNSEELLRKAIQRMNANGGGDGPEAVYQGLYDMATQLKWRANSLRFAILVGDAPPHAYAHWVRTQDPAGTRLTQGGDHWPVACPSGLDPDQVVATLEGHRIQLSSLVMGQWAEAQHAFAAMAEATGGQALQGNGGKQSLKAIRQLLEGAFAQLGTDEEVLRLALECASLDAAQLAKQSGLARLVVAQSLSRLGSRGFFESMSEV